MTITSGRYKERRVNGLIWDRYSSGASMSQTKSTSSERGKHERPSRAPAR